jgi:hypothetical protein
MHAGCYAHSERRAVKEVREEAREERQQQAAHLRMGEVKCV